MIDDQSPAAHPPLHWPVQRQRHVVAGAQALIQLNGTVSQHAGIAELMTEFQLASIELLEVEQVVDQAQQTFGIFVGDAQQLIGFFRHGTHGTAEQ